MSGLLAVTTINSIKNLKISRSKNLFFSLILGVTLVFFGSHAYLHVWIPTW